MNSTHSNYFCLRLASHLPLFAFSGENQIELEDLCDRANESALNAIRIESRAEALSNDVCKWGTRKDKDINF